MHLRTKLTGGVALATVITFAVVGFVAIRTAKHAVRERVDARLLADLADLRASTPASGPSVPSVGDEYALVVVTPNGTTVRSMTGSRGDPDAPPDVRFDELPGDGDIADAAGADGTLYRIAAIDVGDGQRLVVGAPVDDLQGLADELIGRLLAIGLIAASGLTVMVWWWIRRTTRPIETLTRRADAIAGGDVDRSLSVPATTAELVSLTQALDAMIASVDASLEVRARSEARLREFIADASHELRTPLTSVSGYLQLDLDGALADPDEHRRSIGRAVDEAARMGRLVADLQLLAELDEPDSGALWTTELVDLTALVATAVRSSATFDPSRTWRTDLGSVPLTTHAHQDQLRQVLDNLLANVRTHTPPGTATTVTVRANDDDVVIEVTDDGPGMSDDEMNQAFDRFWRQDPSRSRSSGGTGLGLSIVSAIVSAHGGSVGARRAEPHGLTVRVCLPRRASGRSARHRRSTDDLTRAGVESWRHPAAG